jgi:hypothetical protein
MGTEDHRTLVELIREAEIAIAHWERSRYDEDAKWNARTKIRALKRPLDRLRSPETKPLFVELDRVEPAYGPTTAMDYVNLAKAIVARGATDAAMPPRRAGGRTPGKSRRGPDPDKTVAEIRDAVCTIMAEASREGINLTRRQICERLDARKAPLPPGAEWAECGSWTQAYDKPNYRGAVQKWLWEASRDVV